MILIHAPERDASQNPLLSKKSRPRFVSKKERRHRKSTERRVAADNLEVEEQHKIMKGIIFRNEPGIICLPCCAGAYEEKMVIGFDKKKSGGKGVVGCVPQSQEAEKKSGGKVFMVVPPVTRSG